MKKKLAQDRQETFKTGGGQKKHIEFTDDECIIIECMGQAAKPLTNPADSDSKADTDTYEVIEEPCSKIARKSQSEATEIKPKTQTRSYDTAAELLEMRTVEHQLKIELLQTKLKTAKLELEIARIDHANKSAQNLAAMSSTQFAPDFLNMNSQSFH